ncbi:unnamed protein product [Rhizoctonia solani]|uniref:Uncharacterized protein n=1 Tax=Rhizoctonia solani TaxID=456999 RepID=A0A8H3E6W6_9AGAM|nr:unnamed protein product [Rhizoctonia solani]
MLISLRRLGASRKLLTRCYSTHPNSSKRSTSPGFLPPPKLNYEDLVHPDQASNAKNRNVMLPERTWVALRSDLDAWKIATRAEYELSAGHSRVGETVRTTSAPEDKESAIRQARALSDSVHAHERELARLEKSLLDYDLGILHTSHSDVPF